MKPPRESDQPGSAGDRENPEADPKPPGTGPSIGSGQARLTPEQLTNVIRKLETGFYDSPEVREHIARRVREELDP